MNTGDHVFPFTVTAKMLRTKFEPPPTEWPRRQTAQCEGCILGLADLPAHSPLASVFLLLFYLVCIQKSRLECCSQCEEYQWGRTNFSIRKCYISCFMSIFLWPLPLCSESSVLWSLSSPYHPEVISYTSFTLRTLLCHCVIPYPPRILTLSLIAE
jgi:hypothetical protein